MKDVQQKTHSNRPKIMFREIQGADQDDNNLSMYHLVKVKVLLKMIIPSIAYHSV